MVQGVLIVVVLATGRVAFRPLRDQDPATLRISSFAVSCFLQQPILLIHTGRHRPRTDHADRGLRGCAPPASRW